MTSFFSLPPFFLWISNSIAHTGPALGSHTVESPALPQPLRRDRQRAPAAAAAAPEQKQQQPEQEGAQDGRQPLSVRPRELGVGDGKKGCWSRSRPGGSFLLTRGKPVRGRHAWKSGRAWGAWDLLRYWGRQAQLGVALPGGAGAPSLLGRVQILKERGPWRPPPYSHTLAHCYIHFHVHTLRKLHTPIFPQTPHPLPPS